MKTIGNSFQQMLDNIPADTRLEIDWSFAIANRIDYLIKKNGLSKRSFAEALGKRPSEVSKWLSGQHNFTLRTLATISAYFGEELIHPRG